jgi:hypothetical protein
VEDTRIHRGKQDAELNGYGYGVDCGGQFYWWRKPEPVLLVEDTRVPPNHSVQHLVFLCVFWCPPPIKLAITIKSQSTP